MRTACAYDEEGDTGCGRTWPEDSLLSSSDTSAIVCFEALHSVWNERSSGRKKLFLVAKEARIGLVNGLILGSLSVVCIGLYLVLHL